MTATIRGAGLALALLVSGCASVPAGPPPEIQRLEDRLARLHDDPRIAPNAVAELQNADAAVDALARDGDRLDEPMFHHGVYLADRLIGIAEASGLARYEERRGEDLDAERDRLQTESAQPGHAVRPLARGTFGRTEHDDLAAIQAHLAGLESHLDERGLVVSLGDFMFERGAVPLRDAAMRSLDTLARALRDGAPTALSIEAYAGRDRELAGRRADGVRAYLAGRGVDARMDTRIDAASVASGRSHVDIVIRVVRR